MAERRVFKPEDGVQARRFEKAWCEQCSRHRAREGCAILLASAIHETDEPDYPEALVIGDAGPMCAAFEPAAIKGPTYVGLPDAALYHRMEETR